MDTKRLLELAVEAGINPRHDDVAFDCIEPWTKYLISSPEEMADVWIDFLAEMDVEGDSYKAIINQVGKQNAIPVIIGAIIKKCLIEGAEKYVEKHHVEWWEECMGYAGDMECDAEEARGDYLYDLRKEERE